MGEDKEKPEYDEFGLQIQKPKPAPSPDEEEVVVSSEPTIVPSTSTTAPPTPPAIPKTTEPPPPPVPKVLAEISASDKKWNEKKMFSEDPSDPTSTIGTGGPVSEWSHQQIVRRKEDQDKPKGVVEVDEEDEWQEMPAFASYDLYDDDGRLIAKAAIDSDDEGDVKGGAAKGYTRVYDDEDAQSATSMDENTNYLFKETEDDEASRNPLSQMQATKELLTEGQRIAYVGVCKLAMVEMGNELAKLDGKSKGTKKELTAAKESMKMWSQKMMVRLYMHMDISPAEQIMIEQLAEHGVLSSDLTPALLKNSRVHNPMATTTTASSSSLSLPRKSSDSELPGPPPYSQNPPVEPSSVQDPTQLHSQTLDIDIRWTVLCDLFLVLIADSVYDARSRVLLERVGVMLGVPWLDICRFEKRVTDALEIQESTEQNWSEKEHMETRMKRARNMRFMMMGLATIGGGLVIGLSGGLLAPVIGAGIAAGFTTIGVAGTGTFLAGAGGTALIASGMVASGAAIGGKASYNRTKSVTTFEYRPLHNAKRVNLIITVSGWMSGKVDDVRLPYSTIDPIMGDLFSIHWEPEMLTSMGQTINILATEVLTQSLQQILGSTVLVALMASLQLPVVLTKLSYLLDNPWSVSLDRANAAGLILADSLINRNLGVRPVTLVGYSLGARVIFSCLKELQRRRAFGLVQNVYIFGSPVVVKKDEYAKAVSVVSGRYVNGYARNDWILGYLFRATSGGILRVAGLAPVEDIPGVENVDVTELVDGHMAYRAAIPKLLRKVGFIVLSDEFTEIEDPDPDRHRERQRELISELDEARKELEKEDTKKKRFTFFGRGKEAAKKKDWETYEDPSVSATKDPKPTTEDPNSNILFDVDAIRAELARSDKNEVTVKELNSSLPPLKLTTGASNSGLLNTPSSPYANLRHSKSFGDRSYNTPTTTVGYRAASSSTALDAQSNRAGNNGYKNYGNNFGNPQHNGFNSDSDSEDEFGNRRRKPGEEEGVMTFDTSGYQPPPRTSSGGGGYGNLGVGGYGAQDRSGGYRQPQRSSSMYTTPSYVAAGAGAAVGFGAAAAAMEGRNVWADDDDDEFGEGEGEMTMTFA